MRLDSNYRAELATTERGTSRWRGGGRKVRELASDAILRARFFRDARVQRHVYSPVAASTRLFLVEEAIQSDLGASWRRPNYEMERELGGRR